MKGFIVYPTSRIVENKAYVYLFGKLENGESFLTINYFRPYFYVNKKDIAVVKEITGLPEFEITESDMVDFDKKKLSKIVLDVPKDVPLVKRAFIEAGVTCYEADIRFAMRFLMDHGIKASVEIEGEFEKGERVSRIYNEPMLKPCEYLPSNLKTLSIDIETDGKAKRIFCISLYSEGIEEVLIISDKKLKNAISYKDEEEMLSAFTERIIEIDPDIITGWNLIGFDLRVIEERMKAYKQDFILGRMDWKCKLSIFQDFFRESRADFPGRMVLDGISLLKMSFINLDSYKLDYAAEKLIGERKIEVKNKVTEIERLFLEDPQKLVQYNLKDSVLVYKILNEKKVLDLAIEKSSLTGLSLDKGRASIAALDSLYLREARKKGFAARSSEFLDREERIKGGFVMESKSGLFDYILVCDFKSLYPSIIRTFNIDPIAFSKKGEIIAPNGARFENNEGILPRLIQDLWEARDKAKKEKNEIKSFAIKIIMNSFFGVLANPNCRFYSIDMANAITHFGQMIVKETAEQIRKSGLEVIYGDTDSVFVKANVNDYEKACVVGKKIQKEINSYWNKRVSKEFKRDSFLELEYEKVYAKFFMPKIRGGEAGAKKRYAGLIETPSGKGDIQITGLEFVRSDWTMLARNFQMKLLEMCFAGEDPKVYVKKFIDEIYSGKHDSELVYRKNLTKKLSDYTKTTPPHVKAARLLDSLTDRVVRYIMTVDGPQPIQKLSSEIDYKHYIEKQIKPIAESILSVIGVSFDSILEGEDQKSLSDY